VRDALHYQLNHDKPDKIARTIIDQISEEKARKVIAAMSAIIDKKPTPPKPTKKAKKPTAEPKPKLAKTKKKTSGPEVAALPTSTGSGNRRDPDEAAEEVKAVMAQMEEVEVPSPDETAQDQNRQPRPGAVGDDGDGA
jgi:hypothetical protein